MTITVFLADDHRIIRDGLRAILSNEPDIDVIGEAGDGREAVQRIADLRPGVAVVDILMPELNGIDAAQKIRKASPSTQVIILSMHASRQYVHRALQVGVCGYVLKDSAGSELIQAIHTVRDGHQYLSSQISRDLIDDYVHRHENLDDLPLDRLTSRQREVVQLVAEGKSSVEIAEILSLSARTVDTYRSRVMKRLDISSITELTKFAIRHGLTSLE